MTEQEIDELFAASLQGSYDDHEPWEAVAALHRNGDRLVFERASSGRILPILLSGRDAQIFSAN